MPKARTTTEKKAPARMAPKKVTKTVAKAVAAKEVPVKAVTKKPEEKKNKKVASKKTAATENVDESETEKTHFIRNSFDQYKGHLGGILTIEVIQSDITKEEVDAITNDANASLKHGKGVALDISKAGGPDINKESKAYIEQHGPIPTGQVGFTGPGKLTCQHVIHAVGPKWSDSIPQQENINLLSSTVYSILAKAGEL